MLKFIRSLPNTAVVPSYPEAGQVHWDVSDRALRVGIESGEARQHVQPMLLATAALSAMLAADVSQVTTLQITRRVEDYDVVHCITGHKLPVYSETPEDGWVRDVWPLHPAESSSNRAHWEELLDRCSTLGQNVEKVLMAAQDRYQAGMYRLFRTQLLRYSAAKDARDLDWDGEEGQAMVRSLERDAIAQFLMGADVRVWFRIGSESTSVFSVLEQKRIDRPVILMKPNALHVPEIGDRIGVVFQNEEGGSKVHLAHVIATCVAGFNKVSTPVTSIAAYMHDQINDPFFKI